MRNHREKEKCHHYWPVDCHEHKIIPGTGKLGELRLNMRNDDEVAPCIRRREISVEKWPKKSDQTPHRVVQFQMTNWPDHGVPERHKDVTELIRTFRGEVTKTPDSQAPILLHCSAGVGRTGTVIAIDRVQQALAQAQLPETFCVKSLVKQLRRSRPKMVQTIEQYRFVYDNVDELLGLKTQNCGPNGRTSVRQRTSQSVKRAKKKRPESTVGNGTKERQHGKLCRHKSQSWDGGLDQNATPVEVTRRNRANQGGEDAELRARAGIEPMPPSQPLDDFEQADGASSDEFHHSELENGPGFLAAPGSPGSTTTGGSTNMTVAPLAHVRHHKEPKPKHRNKMMEKLHSMFASPTKKKSNSNEIHNRDSYKPIDSMRQINGTEAKNVSSHFTMPSKSASTLPMGSKMSDFGKGDNKRTKTAPATASSTANLKPKWNKPQNVKDKS